MPIQRSTISVGLVISFVGTLLTIPFNKKYHVVFGTMLTAWSVLHSWQHRKPLEKHLYGEVDGINGIFAGVTNFFNQKTAASFLSQHVEVLHYVPGRIRLYSQQLLNNVENVRQVEEYLHSMGGLHQFSINPATGSILIQYSPEDVKTHPLLKELEHLVMKQYRGRKI